MSRRGQLAGGWCMTFSRLVLEADVWEYIMGMNDQRSLIDGFQPKLEVEGRRMKYNQHSGGQGPSIYIPPFRTVPRNQSQS
jgi:hypothetical protein